MAIIDQTNPNEPDYFSRQVRTARRFFRSEARPTGANEYSVVSGGMEICVPGYEIKRNNFPYLAIEFVSGGHGSLMLDGRSYELATGAVYAYGPSVPHRITADRNQPLEKYFVDCLPLPDYRTASGFPNENTNILGNVLFSRSPESLRTSFEELIEYGIQHSPQSGAICSRIVQLLALKISETAREHRETMSGAYTAYRRCRQLIFSHYLKLSDLKAVAAAGNVDVSYLCRLFKRFDSQSPYRYLTRLRMNHAAELLVRDGLSVKQTAGELGYQDSFVFSRRFKTIMGDSPKCFTEQHGSRTEK